MNTFSANFSSSVGSDHLPSNTPHRRNLFSQPSEPSTTPAVPPPSQIFGSSQLGTGVSKLQFGRGSTDIQSSAPRAPFSAHNRREGFQSRPTSKLFQNSTNTVDSQEDEDYTDDSMQEEWDGDETQQNAGDNFASSRMQGQLSAASLMKFSTNNSMRQSFNRSTRAVPSVSQLPRKGKENFIPGLAKEVTKGVSPARLVESDPVILGTEQILQQLDAVCDQADDDIDQLVMISGAARELVSTWSSNRPQLDLLQGQVGPSAGSEPFDQARFITSLLLDLRHPQGVETPKHLVSQAQTVINRLHTKPMPQILLEWMHQYHHDLETLVEPVMSHPSNPAGSPFFWDVVHTFILRGRISNAMQILANADFRFTMTKTDQGIEQPKYNGSQLQVIQSAVFQTRQLLNACPAVQNEEWDVIGQDWDLYRKEVERAIADLVDLADGRSGDMPSRSKSKPVLPHDVYESLRTVCDILLGDVETILVLAQDWLEASLLLAIWWNGVEEPSVAQWSFDVSRANQTGITSPKEAYLRRIRDSFLCVTDPDADGSLHLNTLSPVEIGVGAVLQGDIRSALRILRTLSLPIAATTAEIAIWAGHLMAPAATESLDNDDLMVLNYGQENETIQKDDVVASYVESLFEKNEMYTAEGVKVEGWEVAFALATRMDNQERATAIITEYVDALTVTERSQAEKLMQVCRQLQFRELEITVAETFADHLINTSTNYGTALLCYARAGAESKIRQVVDLLNSYCLVQTIAYPRAEDMDDTLVLFVNSPKQVLAQLSDHYPAAAETLRFYLAGYACLRNFYTFRDQEIIAAQQQQSASLRPLARKRAATKALIAAINSAADSIYGGLYDASRRSAIQVDGLLPLLGEATALLAKPGEKRILTSDQMYAILAAIEDLQTVGQGVFNATEECMEASLRNYRGSAPPSPHAMLKKSVSSGTNSNFSFSMMGSEMLARSEDSLAAKSMGSAVLVDKTKDMEQRGWDWRAQFTNGHTISSDILTYLRVGIAKELSLAELDGNSTTF